MSSAILAPKIDYAARVVELLRKAPVEQQARVLGFAEAVLNEDDNARWDATFANTPDSVLDAFIEEAREAHTSGTVKPF